MTLLLALVVTGYAAQGAPPRLANLFQDGMVLQREAEIPVWGWAEPGASITVSFAGSTGHATAGADSTWRVQLAPASAGGPHTMTVQGGGAAITLRDIYVGDVWVASGQSNMEWPLAQATNGRVDAAAANDPLLREFAVPHGWSEEPAPDVAGRWAPAEPQHAGRFSAVAYYFARDLRSALEVPVGIIHASWGGSNIETWMSRDALGVSDSAWTAMMEVERARDSAMREALRARIGALPTVDAGMADDRAVWADPLLDDAAWQTIAVPGLWEQAGYAGLDGTAWYRTTFSLSEAEAAHGVRISLGMIDDDDITWVNGVEVGRTNGYSQRRLYHAPPAALRAGTNVLAIRVMDAGGGGGPYGDPTLFHVDTGTEQRPLDGSWRFRVGSVAFQADGQRINKIPTVLYNRMVHPLQRYPIRGVIWYQGESNANNDEQAAAYRQQFVGLIRSWRREWNGSASDLPFLWVQLPNFGAVDTVPPDRAAWATLRESQAAALRLPATGQVVAIDLGDPGDIHPLDKEPVGQRLAHVALRVAYGKAVMASGPTYRGHAVQDRSVVIEFDDVGGGLVSRSGERVRGFAIAGADRRWVWADARIEGDRIVVSSPSVTQPVAVRYAWSNSPHAPALYNVDGLPAAPFRTDAW